MKLSELKPGQSGSARGLSRENFLSNRLLEMGYYDGIKISAVLSNGNLCEYRIGETLIALRIKDCDKILVI
jgi:Fe2+ transport system protein FeoA